MGLVEIGERGPHVRPEGPHRLPVVERDLVRESVEVDRVGVEQVGAILQPHVRQVDEVGVPLLEPQRGGGELGAQGRIRNEGVQREPLRHHVLEPEDVARGAVRHLREPVPRAQMQAIHGTGADRHARVVGGGENTARRAIPLRRRQDRRGPAEKEKRRRKERRSEPEPSHLSDSFPCFPPAAGEASPAAAFHYGRYSAAPMSAADGLFGTVVTSNGRDRPSKSKFSSKALGHPESAGIVPKFAKARSIAGEVPWRR